MQKNIKERKLHLLVLAFALGLFLGINASFLLSASEPAHAYLDSFHQLYQYILTYYVDPPKTKDVFYGAMKGMITSLNDPFSRFLDEDSYAELKEDTSGEFVGVGIEITVKDGEIIVISPIEDTPAMKAGIKAGDVIYKVNDTAVKNKNLPDIIKLIRGLPHSKVKLNVRREGFDTPLEFEIERAPIKTRSVSYDIIKGHGCGYLKIKIFSAETARETEKALTFFKENNIDRIIIDLRWNPGGLLDGAIKIADFFLDKGKTIVTTKGREGAGTAKASLAMNDPIYTGKIVILVNKGSASASEILSGAIRDNDRGRLIGEKTFGKGSIQKLLNLTDTTGVTLTVAKYYTPSGASIHGKGISPDIVIQAESVPEGDRKNMNVIVRDKVVEKYVKENREYNSENRAKFIAHLKEKGLAVSEKTANYIFKTEVSRYSKQSLYDLEFDTQLNRAIEAVNEK
jgi:carboxyl-terminal processing protease